MNDSIGFFQPTLANPYLPSSAISSGKQSPENSRSASGVGSDFEAVFVSLMLKQMRTSMSEDGLFGSESSDTYGGIFDLYVGKHVAESSPLGISQMVQTYVDNASKKHG